MVNLEFHDPSGTVEVKHAHAPRVTSLVGRLRQRRRQHPSIREFLWEHSKIPAEDLRRAGCPAWIEIDASKVVRESDLGPR